MSGVCGGGALISCGVPGCGFKTTKFRQYLVWR